MRIFGSLRRPPVALTRTAERLIQVVVESSAEGPRVGSLNHELWRSDERARKRSIFRLE